MDSTGIFYTGEKKERKPRPHKKNPATTVLYIPFGRVNLNQKQLSNNILLIKYGTNGPVNSLRRTPISDDLKTLIRDLLDTGKINIQTQRWLSTEEQGLFKRLIKVAGLMQQLNYQDPTKTTEDYIHRFTVLQGSLGAGNDSQDIRVELVNIIDYLSLPIIGKISKAQAQELKSFLF